MAYSTQADLVNRFARMKLWTDDDASGAVDAAVVGEAIEDADAEINMAVRQKYTFPLALSDATTVAKLKSTSTAIAGYFLALRNDEYNVPESMKTLFDEALAWLKQVASGAVILPGETATDDAPPSGGLVFSGEDVIVTRANFGAM